MDESREEIPRISIDSLRDWHKIKANFTKAVFEQFDQRVRRDGLESERTSLVPLIQQFIDTTFEKAKPNVRINGKKFDDLKDEDDGTLEMEPFDEALDRETWSLYNQRLQWDLELATKRRKRPQEIMDNLENLFKVQDEELDKPMEEQDEDRSLPDGQLVTQFTGLATELILLTETVLSDPETNDTYSKVAALSEGLRQVKLVVNP
ncbi:hypothetical protein BGW80DRAFT_1167156 [Lactifluus volemus]|nr:hypothetical protein BGW80DRAFT_1167156 [Lactifluus volemus]